MQSTQRATLGAILCFSDRLHHRVEAKRIVDLVHLSETLNFGVGKTDLEQVRGRHRLAQPAFHILAALDAGDAVLGGGRVLGGVGLFGGSPFLGVLRAGDQPLLPFNETCERRIRENPKVSLSFVARFPRPPFSG